MTEKVSKMKELFKSCLTLITYKYFVEELIALIGEPQVDVRLEKRVNHIGKRLNTSRELGMNAQIGDYNMDYIILDLGSDVNNITRKTWEIHDQCGLLSN